MRSAASQQKGREGDGQLFSLREEVRMLRQATLTGASTQSLLRMLQKGSDEAWRTPAPEVQGNQQAKNDAQEPHQPYSFVLQVVTPTRERVSALTNQSSAAVRAAFEMLEATVTEQHPST